jgi:hypothetical protein
LIYICHKPAHCDIERTIMRSAVVEVGSKHEQTSAGNARRVQSVRQRQNAGTQRTAFRSDKVRAAGNP